MSKTVLVVDDEPEIRSLLTAYLEADGCTVQQAATGAEALRHAFDAEHPVDLILLDVGLPDQDGFQVLATIRARSQVYVILVTARSEEVDKLVGLRVGADDYITKPFSPREVVARVNTVLRRMRDSANTSGPTDPRLRFPGLVVDPDRREVSMDGRPVEVSALDFDVLVALAQSPGRVFSRPEVLERVWGYEFYGDNRVVDVHIKTLRSALGDDADRPRVSGTVRGVGYKFLLDPEGR